MRLLKLFLLSLIVFFLLLTGIGLLLPAQVRVSRAIDIRSKDKNVLYLLADTARWKDWHPLFFRPDTRPLVNISSQTDSSLEATLRFGDYSQRNSFVLHAYPHTQTKTLQWYQELRSGWLPWQRLRSLMYEGTYGVMMEAGLKRLDSLQTLP